MPRHETPEQSGNTSLAPTEENLADQRRVSCASVGEESYYLLFDKSPLPAWVFDRETLAFLAVNDAAVKQYVFSRGEMRCLTIKDILVSEDISRFASTAGGTEEVNIVTWRMRRKDGTAVSAQVNWQEVHFAGRLARFVTVQDVTLRSQAEQTTQESGQRKDEFLAVLAHELRNPLAPIRNALQVLKQPGVGSATTVRLREMMERQLAHLSRLLDDLLVVSRLNHGRIVLRKEVVNAAVLLGRASEAMQPRFEERRQILAVRAPSDLRLEVDLTRLEQVLLNLLHNAAAYSDPGGRIWLTAERDSAEAVIRVKDAGVGIAPSMLPFIFDPLVQIERRLDHSRGGVGIGLTIVRKLVELHGGTVGAFSAGAGQGAEFVIRLPCLPAEQPG